MGYAFISYSTKNQTSADAFKALLDRNNIPNWMAPYDIPVGKNYAEVIIHVLKDCSCLILLLSNDAMNSKYVPREVERAIDYNKPIFPVQLEHVILTEEFEFYISRNQIVAINKIDESNADVQHLLANLRTCCAKTTSISQTVLNTSPVVPNEPPHEDPHFVPLHEGDIIDGKYRIEKHLAQFDNYALYISSSLKLEKNYFIKVCRQDCSTFHTSAPTVETGMLKKLCHPSLLSLLDIVAYKDFLLTVFDFPEGDFLSDSISAKKTFLESEIIQLALELCDALSYLYEHECENGYHCITPDNIICKTYDSHQFCLLDFYLRTSFPDFINTKKTNYFFYLAPEILNNINNIDCRADIYAIGATLYAMATQNDPTRAPYAIYPLHARCPELSAGLTHIITKCMEPDLLKRYQSIEDLSKDLSSVDKLTKKLSRKSFWNKLLKK